MLLRSFSDKSLVPLVRLELTLREERDFELFKSIFFEP